MTDHLRLLDEPPMAVDPPALLVIPVEQVASIRTGLELAIMLLRLPRCSDANRALAVSELAGIRNALGGSDA